MPTAIGYFFNPFAVTGDAAEVPVDSQPSGSVSYATGYTDKYSLNLLTDPTAIPIGRLTYNQVLFEVTTQLQQYSQYGTPPFITTDQNEGTPFEYPIYARTYYDNVVYENQVASNTATPGTDNSWLPISGDSTGVLPGTIIDYAGVTVPAGYLACDNSAVSRTTYATLLGILSQTQTGTTTNTTNTVTGLTSTAQMYVGMPLESANFPTGTTVLTIVNSTSITTMGNATASGAIAIQFFNWGNGDGSTTFNVPDLRRYTTIGQGGTPDNPDSSVGGVAGTIVGQDGGQETHTQTVAEIAGHTHNYSLPAGGGASLNGSGPNVGLVATPTSSTGSGDAFNVMQPSTVVYKIIKT